MRLLYPAACTALLLAGCGGGTLRPQPAPGPAPAAQRSASLAPAPAAEHVRLGSANTCNIPTMRQEVLRRVNELRAQGHWCGRKSMAPTTPLRWNDALFSAAARHSADMAARNYFDHVGADGRRIAQRVTAEGYPWRSVAENIAGGDTDVDLVMEGWRRSPSHCQAMLEPAYDEVGVACVQRAGTKWGTYWTMVLGKRK